jgi:hypothetical protein
MSVERHHAEAFDRAEARRGGWLRWTLPALLAEALALVAAVPAARAADDARVARGRYLVRIGGCGDCHTPLKVDPRAGPVPDLSRMLSGHPEGAPDPEAKPGPTDLGVIGATFTAFAMPFGIVYAPNLTPDRETGIGAWTERMFVQAMRTGRLHGAPSARPLLPPMPWQNLSEATDDDLAAMFTYLRSIKPIRNRVPAHKVPREAIEKMKAAAAASGH